MGVVRAYQETPPPPALSERCPKNQSCDEQARTHLALSQRQRLADLGRGALTVSCWQWVGEVRECQEILRQLRHFREMAGILKLQTDSLDEEPASNLHDVQVLTPAHCVTYTLNPTPYTQPYTLHPIG